MNTLLLSKIATLIGSAIDKFIHKDVNIAIDQNARNLLTIHMNGVFSAISGSQLPLTIAELQIRTIQLLPTRIKPSDDEFRVWSLNADHLRRKEVKYINVENFYIILRGMDCRVSLNVGIFYACILEYIIVKLIQSAVELERKSNKEAHSVRLDINNVKLIVDMYNTMEIPTSLEFPSLPVNERESEGAYLGELREFVSLSVDNLSTVIINFFEPLKCILEAIHTDLKAIISDKTPERYASLGNEAEALHYLKNCIEKVFECQTALSLVQENLAIWRDVISDVSVNNAPDCLGQTLLDWTEVDMPRSFYEYFSLLFCDVALNSIRVISCLPSVASILTNWHNFSLDAIMKNAAESELPRLRERYLSPHSCILCNPTTMQRFRSKKLPSISHVKSQSTSSHEDTESLDQSVLDVSKSVSPAKGCETDAIPIKRSLSGRPGEASSSSGASSMNDARLYSPESNSSGSDTNFGQQCLAEFDSFTDSSDSSSFGRRQDSRNATVASRLAEFPSFSAMRDISFFVERIYPSTGQGDVGEAEVMEEPSCTPSLLAFRYLLSRLLCLPVAQFLYVYDLLRALQANCTDPFNRTCLAELVSSMTRPRYLLRNLHAEAHPFAADWLCEYSPRLLAHLAKTPLWRFHAADHISPETLRSDLEAVIQLTAHYLAEKEHSTTAKSPKPTLAEYLCGGFVQFVNSSGRLSDRTAYLFSSYLVLCKKSRRFNMASMAAHLASQQHRENRTAEQAEVAFKVKEVIPLKQFRVIDLSTDTRSMNVAYMLELQWWHPPVVMSLPVSGNADVAGKEFESNASINTSNATLVSSTTLSSNSLGSLLKLRIAGSLASQSSLARQGPVGQGDARSAEEGQSFRSFKLILPSLLDKHKWMSHLIYLQSYKLFYRLAVKTQSTKFTFNSTNLNMRNKFALPDAPPHIVFDPMVSASSGQSLASDPHAIKSVSIPKLIEIITHDCFLAHKIVLVVLHTYCKYLTPHEMLDLLIERFNVPLPDFESLSGDLMEVRRMGIVFKDRYVHNVQYKVLSFMIKWLKSDATLYDQLQGKLEPFIEELAHSNKFKSRTEALRSFSKIKTAPGGRPGTGAKLLECLDLGLAPTWQSISLTNVHPVEFARQITLYEWELYSKLEFVELSGKESCMGPNLKASLFFSNALKNWLVWSVLSQQNFHDRVTVMQRIGDLMQLFEQMNNLQGYQETKSALISAPVFRLHEVFDHLVNKTRPHCRRLFAQLQQDQSEEASVHQLSNQYMTDYQRRVKQINPPGLPFIAMGGRTRLIHLEHKMPDWVTLAEHGDARLINFAKCTQLSECMEYFLRFQKYPYNYTVDPVFRQFLVNLEELSKFSFEQDHELDDAFHNLSVEIQPREGSRSPDTLTSTESGLPIRKERLSQAELRVANHLNHRPLDVNLTVHDREFKIVSTLAGNTQLGSSATIVEEPGGETEHGQFGRPAIYTPAVASAETGDVQGPPPLPPRSRKISAPAHVPSPVESQSLPYYSNASNIPSESLPPLPPRSSRDNDDA